MSILKSILHHYNKTTKNYDTLHPETESAQVTDWHQAVVGSLASKVLPAVVSELTTDSVMGKLIKMLLNASGVKYLIDTNGYICFGQYFGGLIIQWGITGGIDGGHGKVIFPINFKNSPLYCTCTIIHSGDPQNANSVYDVQNSQMLIGSSGTSNGYYWMVIGY